MGYIFSSLLKHFIDLETSATTVRLSRYGRFLAASSPSTSLTVSDVGNAPRSIEAARAVSMKLVISSSDGKKLFTADDSSRGYLWDLDSGRLIKQFYESAGNFVTAKFDSRSAHFTTQSDGGTARFMSAETGAELAVLIRDSRSFEFNSLGDRMIAKSANGLVRVWDTSSGKLLMETEEPETSYDLSKYADRAVVWSRASIDVWDVIAGKQIATIKRNTRGAIGADISDDGSRIAIQSTDDGRVTVWDAGTGRRISTLDSTWPEIRNIRSGFNRNGSRILVKDNAGIVELFDSATGARIEQLHNRFQGIAEFTEDGERILLAGEDGQIALWNAMTGTLLAVLTDANLTYRLAFTSDSNFIVHGGPTPRIWDARSGRQIAELRGHSSDVTGVRFSRDNSRFLTIGRDGETLLWDVATATTLSKMVVPLGNREVFFAGNGQRIVIIGKGFQTTVFETATGRKTVVAPGNTAKMSGDFSPDETYLASVLAAKKVRVWESGNGAEITELQGHTDNINGVMFSPDGKTILTVSDDKTARLWESVSGRQVAVWEHPSEVVKGQFSPDGTHVVTISKSGARLWKVEDDGRGIDLSNEQRYDEIIFSPDGSVVLLISFGRKEMTEFDVKTGQSLALVTLTSGSGELVYYRNPFDNLIVSADHSMIGSQDNETVWPLPWSLQDYVDKVKAMLPRCLTPDERKAAYLDTEPPEWCVEMEKWPYNTDKWKAWLKDKTTAREELAASHPPPR